MAAFPSAGPHRSATAVLPYSAITSIGPRRRTGPWTMIDSLSAGMVYAHTGLTNGQTYYYQVAAVNAAGEGPRTATVFAIPRTVPSSPARFVRRWGNGDRELVWAAPTSDGGSPLTKYSVYRGTSSGSESLLVDAGSALMFVDKTVLAGYDLLLPDHRLERPGREPEVERGQCHHLRTAHRPQLADRVRLGLIDLVAMDRPIVGWRLRHQLLPGLLRHRVRDVFRQSDGLFPDVRPHIVNERCALLLRRLCRDRSRRRAAVRGVLGGADDQPHRPAILVGRAGRQADHPLLDATAAERWLQCHRLQAVPWGRAPSVSP